MSRALAGRRILLTGHTGFKGGWLALWLRRLGADTVAVALPAPQDDPSFFAAAGVEGVVDHRIADITDRAALSDALRGVDAELVIHMAAQSLVRASYDRPVDTFHVNVTGTAAVLDAARNMPSLRAAIVVTSDKCYANNEWTWAYRENDRLGGGDPYSASKACTELVVDAWRRSFFAGANAPLIASVRAGNVFGGGDWAADRLIPDIVRAAVAAEPVRIRNPHAVRPWQHVLEPLAGYLQLATRLLEGDAAVADAWNFGPDVESAVDVRTIATRILASWGPGAPALISGGGEGAVAEAGVLRVDSTRAKVSLGWRPRLELDAAMAMTVDWYRAYYAGGVDMRAFSEEQIDRYVAGAPVLRTGAPLSVVHANGGMRCG